MIKLNESNEDRPTPEKVFISEDLTISRHELFFQTRKLKKSKEIKDTFTRDGKIVIKLENDNDRMYFISNSDDLDSFCVRNKIDMSVILSTRDMGRKQETHHRAAEPMDSQMSVSQAGYVTPTHSQSLLDPKAKSFTPQENKSSEPIQSLFRQSKNIVIVMHIDCKYFMMTI